MKDYEKTKAMLVDFGVGFTEGEFSDEGLLYIKCEHGDKKVGGYSGFYTVFEFDKDGNFLKIGAFE